MESLPLLLKGIGLGIALAAPVGPIGLLVIRRTLLGGLLLGLATGLGVALADGLYGVIAATALEAAKALFAFAGIWPNLLGGLVLLWLGITGLRARPARGEATATLSADSLLLAMGSGFILTLANPMTIATFAALFLGLGVAEGGAVVLVAGVFSGSLLWWMVLTGSISALRKSLSAVAMIWLDRLSAAVLIGFGVWAVSGAVQ